MKRLLLPFALTLAASSCAANESINCDDAYTTYEMNQCAKQDWDASTVQMQQYLQAAVEKHEDDPELVAAIQQSQSQWQAYMQAHCGAILTQWRDGTIRGVMTLACKQQLTDDRAMQLWNDFLTPMDGSDPELPAPTINR